jgi:hypothetical protein
MGISALTAGVLSFGSSVYDYATWDRLSTTDKMAKVQNKFGSNVQYDATTNHYGYYIDGSSDVYLGPAALESKRMAHMVARHELKHLSDYNRHVAGRLSLPRGRILDDHFEIRAYKHELRGLGITPRDYSYSMNFIRTNHGYRGFGPFLFNPFMYINPFF